MDKHDDDLFVIFMEGGGHCADEETCKERSKSYLGSFKYWLPSIPGAGCYSNSRSEKPDFYEEHHILIPYCTGDWHSVNLFS